MNNKIVAITVVVVVIVLGVWWYVGKSKAEPASGEPIKIGFVGSLTGGLASWGTESKNSIALAVSEINAEGGVDGRPIEIIYEDGACDAKAATNAAQKLITIDKVPIIISYCSLESVTVAPIAEANKVILFAPAATTPNLTTAGDYVFRLAPSDAAPGKAMGLHMNEEYDKVALITESSEFSQALRNSFLSENKNELVVDETFGPTVNDFRSSLSKLKRFNPEAVFVNANRPTAAGLMVKQARELGLDTKFYGVYWGSDPEFLKVAGQTAEGFRYYSFTVDETRADVQRFLANYEKYVGETAPNPQFAILSYDGMYVLAEAIKEAGTNPDKLRDYLYQMEEFSGLSGNISFDENGDSAGIDFKLFEVRNGKPVEM
ncbi:MAG: hypothetical protein A2589_01860 [Candidatus Vogelbacteria bacterium RIFOXYD1_FULL_46_19]|uniref:Leucine-binding protein domain-containing protein n=1 Tax=Candidatus Vogelbacteria bacterium RIFOXYD1_FULL_46_19 TaxID=1802439 RepID=A0A1G2QG94_9BACT|nr:MAG: hypothetical protein A2589_01860 [Candidatus Vogelbacteria bacterium RIFOXYD1_FULL_46_19]